MKANNPHHWEIVLRGKKPNARKCCFFTGTVDEALSHADVMECQVRFTVIKFSIQRLERAKPSASVPSVSALRPGSVSKN